MRIPKHFRADNRVFFAILVCVLQTAAWARDIPAPLQSAVDQAVGKVKPALVRIHVVSTAYRDGREFKYQSSGSGVIISKEGHVITNHHVAGHSTRLMCTLTTREEVEAELIGTDALTDIAVIKLLPEDGREFPVVSFGDSDAVHVGDHVLAMGSPLSLSQSVTLGIVSNNEMIMPRRMGFGSFTLDGEDVGTLVKWIGHDAVIYPGNSGGPLVSLSGEIIGINEISLGLGGAIPGNLAKSVAEELIEKGEVERAWLGMNIQPLLKHSPHETGILVTGTIKGSPADDAEFESGDILLELAGEPITVRFEEQLPEFNRLAASLAIGESVPAVVLRDGKKQRLAITPSKREDRLPDEVEFKQWGISGRNLSYILAKELKREDTNGVMVTTMGPGGPAADAKPAIGRDDVIVRVEDTPINNVDDLRRVTDELTKDATEPVPALTTFERRTGTFVTVVNVGIRELHDPGLEVKKAWLPVETQVLTRDIAVRLDKPELTGFRISQVYSGSTAQKAGLKEGDIITAVDGEPLIASAPEDYEELPTLIRNYRVGTTVELAVLREDEEMTVPVELVRSPMLVREMRRFRDENFEYTVRNISFFDKAEEEWADDQQGVLVQEVTSGGWAALGQLAVGDLIQEVNGTAITDIDSLNELMDTIEAEEPRSVVMKVLRGIYTVYVELEPKWDAD